MASPANNSQSNNNLPVSVIQDFIKTEQQRVSYKVEELKIRSKEIDSNERLAKVSMEYQFKVLEKKPKQHKETTITYAICVGFLLLIFLGFLGYMVTNGYTAFVEKFLGWISYLIVSILGYFAGRLSKSGNQKNNGPDNMSEAHIVE
jgi:hypothetical protein